MVDSIKQTNTAVAARGVPEADTCMDCRKSFPVAQLISVRVGGGYDPSWEWVCTSCQAESGYPTHAGQPSVADLCYSDEQ